jgi:hypothetical protein
MTTGTVKFQNLMNRIKPNTKVNSIDVNTLTFDDETPKQIVVIELSDMDRLMIIKTSKGYHIAEEYKLKPEVNYVREFIKYDMNFSELTSEIKKYTQS